MPTKILVVSPDEQFIQEISHLLETYASDAYHIEGRDKIQGQQRSVSAAIIDEDFIQRDPEAHLARLSFELYPTPYIYLVGRIQSEDAFKSIRSLATDYLLKEHISGAVLHNSLKYAVESTRLKLELEKQQNRYKSLFYNSIEPAFFLTADWEIENVNSSFSDLFEIDFNRCKGLSFRKFFQKPTEFDQLVKGNVFATENQLDVVIRFKLPGKERRFLGHLKISVLREYD